MPSEVEVYSLWGGPVPSAVAGRECDPDNSSAIPSGEPALLVVALPAHRLLLLALWHPAFPGQAQDVGVAAEDWPMLYGGEHPSVYLSARLTKNYLEGGSFREVNTVMSATPGVRLPV